MGKFNIVFDEIEFAKEILEKKHKYLGVNYSAKYIIRYCYKDFIIDGKLNDDALYMHIMEFLLSAFPKDEIIKNIPTIKKYITKYSNSKYDLKKCGGIIVTRKELNTISGLNNSHLEILAFSILIIKKIENFKLNKKCDFFKLEFKDYYKEMTGDKGDMKRQNQSIRRLCESGLITLPDIKDMGKNKGFTLNYIDFDENAEILIDDLREIPLIYRKWRGENVVNCKECGRLVLSNLGRPNQYCKECANEKQLEYQRESMRKIRNVKSK